MPTFRILYLRQSKLEATETLSGGVDLLDAIEKASDRVGPETAEIWSDQGKVGVVAPLPRRSHSAGAVQPDGEEAEIAQIMKARLSQAP
jgi:hypothetical protein